MIGIEIIQKYFPDLTPIQEKKFIVFGELFTEWNSQINLVSRKDIDELYIKHILHSLSIAKFVEFIPKQKVLDVGTGGGFPGLPLAILFPETQFHCIDRIGKKIMVVQDIAENLDLENVKAEHITAEHIKDKYNYVLSRAVTKMDRFVPWITKNISLSPISPQQSLANGIIALKGGDLEDELENYPEALIKPLTKYFEEEFFETKKLVYIPKMRKK